MERKVKNGDLKASILFFHNISQGQSETFPHRSRQNSIQVKIKSESWDASCEAVNLV